MDRISELINNLPIHQYNSINLLMQVMQKLDIIDHKDWEVTLMWSISSFHVEFAGYKNSAADMKKKEHRKKSMPWLDKKNKRFYG